MLDKTQTKAKKKLEESVADMAPRKVELKITQPRISAIRFKIVGTAPYMQSRFTKRAMDKMMATQKAGSQARGKKVRDARDFDKDYKEAMYQSAEGWCGIPAGAFRTAMIDVCRLVGFKMTLAKLSVFVVPDGFDKANKKPLVKIHGTPEMDISGMRNDNGGLDLRARPMWPKWSAEVVVEHDEDQFSAEDVTNLMLRVGQQCGIGEGRHNSRMSTGIGFGTFKVDKVEIVHG